MQDSKPNYSESISNMYGIDLDVLQALENGEDDIMFKEIVAGLFAAIDGLVTEILIDDDNSFEYKYQLFDMMNWAGKHLIEFNRQ